MSEIDRAIDAMERLSLLAQLRDMIAAVLEIDKRQCGNCYFWMKSRDCPYEANVAGFSRGPSCDHPPCGKFEIKPQVLALKAERVRDAIAFAERFHLPIPAAFTSHRGE